MSKKEQIDNAMNELLGGLTANQGGTGQEPSQKETAREETSPAQQKYREKYERVCTIQEVELMNKVREIARREGVPIKSIIEFMLQNGVKTYESNNGVLRVRKTKGKKGDLSEAFGMKK